MIAAGVLLYGSVKARAGQGLKISNLTSTRLGLTALKKELDEFLDG
jgi:hypothetical protein